MSSLRDDFLEWDQSGWLLWSVRVRHIGAFYQTTKKVLEIHKNSDP